jgi:cytochrome c oxidase cbb3-type subunit 1
LSLAFYGMSTFEGPMMAIKTVNALSHYTDWTIGHVPRWRPLGWVAMISIGSLYHLLPKVFGRQQMHSIGLINTHFWLATIGTVLYIASMWGQRHHPGSDVACSQRRRHPHLLLRRSP